MKKTLMRMLTLMLLAILSLGARAQVTVDFSDEVKNNKSGKVAVKSQETATSGTTVTITVSPASGYTITAKDITVVATRPAGGTRTIEIAGPMTVNGPKANPNGTFSTATDFTFFVEDGFGALVQSITYQPANRDNGAKREPTSYAIYVADKGYLKNVNNEHELDFNNFASNTSNSMWVYTTDQKLQCGTVYLKDNGTTFVTTTDANEATAWTLETDANNSAKHYFKSGDKYMRSGWILSNEYTEGYTTDDRYGAYEVRGTNNVVWIADGTYVIMNRKLDYIRNDKNPPNLLYQSGSNIKLNHAESDAIAQWEITVDEDGYYTFKNVSTEKYMECASGTSNCAITSTTGTEDKFKFSLKLYGPSNKWTDWGKTINGNDCTTYPSLYAPWFYSICPKTGNNDNTGLNAPKDEPKNIVKSEDSNNKSAGSQWNIIPYELTNELSIEGESSISAVGEYSLTATGATILKGSKNPNNNNLPIYPAGSYNDNITYEWSLTAGSDEYASLSEEQTVNKVSSVKLNVTSVPEMTTDIVVHCQVTNGAGDTWGDDFTITYIVEQGITSLSQITHPNGWYKLLNDVSDTPGVTEFKGSLNGDFHTVSGLSAPLFSKVDGAVIKNVMFKDVSISRGNNVGTVAGEANGASRIYNCGVLNGTVTSTDGAAGGLVGHIAANSSVRVVNCYNYADVSGSNYAAGIVGKNDGTVGNVRIALCMMYGKVSNASNISPVYAGNHVSNVQNYTEYNYWRYNAGIAYTAYNDQIAIGNDDYLSRFPFYRHILNTHRQLAAFFLFGTNGGSVGDVTSAEMDEIGHWVRKQGDGAPLYPVIERWEKNTHRTTQDIKNNLPTTTDDYAGRQLTNMGRSGYLTVKYTIGSTTGSIDLPITDMDSLRYDFTWGKVVLPYANELWTQTDYSQVVTGWKITSVTGGTEGSLTNYNFADRDCTAKDIFDNSGFIFAQGGNYIVPYGVTDIEITAHFATAYYLSDPAYDMGYNTTYGGSTQLGGTVPSPFHEQPVYTDLKTLVNSKLATTNNPHDQAIVLVGNYHYNMNTIGGICFSDSKAVTIMSADEDCNQEPDYAWYSYMNSDRNAIPAMRFDFVANIPMGMSSHVNGSSYYPRVAILKPRGWFEMTETSLIQVDEFEIQSSNFKEVSGNINNRFVINGGYFVQIVRSFDGACNKLSYMQVGGNAYVKEFYPGNHSKKNYANTLVPINVTGGEIEQCFMTGYGQGTAIGSDIYFWCAGGRIHKFLGAYMEKPRETTSSDGNVNLTAKIDHARIYRFFGGGTTQTAPITGNINITINNSLVDFYCGGPEFGNMNSDKTVTTTATGTTFGEYYGAGFGGTSITYVNNSDATTAIADNPTYSSAYFAYGGTGDGKRFHYISGKGIGTCYKFEYIIRANAQNTISRFYTGYASFSLATTGNVTNTLTNCKIKKLPLSPTTTSSGDFYGAGCQGKVAGTVTSTLTSCEVDGSAYGGGYKASNNSVNVYPKEEPTLSQYITEAGVFTPFGTQTPDIYEWEQGTDGTYDESNKKLRTSVTLTDLGNVTDAITLTIDGGSKIGTDGSTDESNGNVYGGGNESRSLSNTTVNLKGKTQVYGNVFGGGNKAIVAGSTTVNIEQ